MIAIKKFQELMQQNNFDAYIVPTADYHNSEYISDYFKGRAFLSGFTGSAGTLVVLKTRAYLWTDGRYHIQAEKQLENTGIILMKQGLPDVPTIFEFLRKKLKANEVLAFDGKVLNANFVLELKKNINDKVIIKSDVDLLNDVWVDRPSLPFSIIYKLDPFFTGKTYEDKLNEIHEIMKESRTDTFILSSLEDQAWLYNLRGNDINHTPVFLSFTIITLDHTILFVDTNKIDLMVERYLDDNEITVKPYSDIYDMLLGLRGKSILIDLKNTNYQVYSSIYKNNKLIDAQNPTILLKAVKNETEIKNIKLAHVKDGVAFTKFMQYVKSYYGKVEMSELSVSDYLQTLREQTSGFVDLSFNTICGWKEHGAMMHYSATKDSNYTLDDSSFLLIDSGGHYLEGTTDITRTLALGEITDEMKLHFTTVLKSVIALTNAVFLKGCKGLNLDILARGPIWKLLLDYKCGTGHGVGYLLSVHEAPNGFRWQIVPERNDSHEFVPGMVTTNEPGIYLENKYGIRIENELLCVNKGSSEFGDFLGFETLTIAPIDLDAINPDLLNQEEKEWLNSYHIMVYNTLSEYLDPTEKEWLLKYTRKI